MAKNKKKKGSRAGKVIWTFFFLLFLGIFCFSAYKLITIYMEYKEGTDEYQGLQKYAVSELSLIHIWKLLWIRMS